MSLVAFTGALLAPDGRRIVRGVLFEIVRAAGWTPQADFSRNTDALVASYDAIAQRTEKVKMAEHRGIRIWTPSEFWIAMQSILTERFPARYEQSFHVRFSPETTMFVAYLGDRRLQSFATPQDAHEYIERQRGNTPPTPGRRDRLDELLAEHGVEVQRGSTYTIRSLHSHHHGLTALTRVAITSLPPLNSEVERWLADALNSGSATLRELTLEEAEVALGPDDARLIRYRRAAALGWRIFGGSTDLLHILHVRTRLGEEVAHLIGDRYHAGGRLPQTWDQLDDKLTAALVRKPVALDIAIGRAYTEEEREVVGRATEAGLSIAGWLAPSLKVGITLSWWPEGQGGEMRQHVVDANTWGRVWSYTRQFIDGYHLSWVERTRREAVRNWATPSRKLDFSEGWG